MGRTSVIAGSVGDMMLMAAHLADQYGLITHRRAREAGLDERDIRQLLKRGDWVRLRRGVYVDRDVWDALDIFHGRPLLKVRGARLELRRPHVVSHDSSALAHDMGVPDALKALVHVTHRKVHGDAVRAGVKHHLAPYLDEQVTHANGLPVLDIPRTALDLAREHGLVVGVAACDQALRRGVTRSELKAARAQMWCWPGSRTMDEAIDLADPGAESWLESEGRVFVVSLGLGRPQTQFGLTDGTRTVFCDMRIGRHVFEIDGRVKYDEERSGGPATDALMREKDRHDFVAGFKLGISRLTAPDLHGDQRAPAARARREYADTCARFGTDIADLAPYIVRRTRR